MSGDSQTSEPEGTTALPQTTTNAGNRLNMNEHTASVIKTVIGGVILTIIVALGTSTLGQHVAINRLEERIKGLESGAADLKSVETLMSQHSSVITRLDEQIRSLELSTNEIKTSVVSQAAVTNFFNTTNAEINSLRSRVDALSASNSSIAATLSHHHDELAKTTTRITSMPDLRERLAIVETTLKHISATEEPKRPPSSSAAARNP